jgi:hypothetical protein
MDAEWTAIVRMFHRRHVYEHNGGEVDQKYLDDSGDSLVKLKQHVHETRESVHDLLVCLAKMVRTFTVDSTSYCHRCRNRLSHLRRRRSNSEVQ